MVFESIVVDVLNRLLGDYFENLDTSQLQLGIWGGELCFNYELFLIIWVNNKVETVMMQR